MQRDVITVERFYTSQTAALELKLVAGASGLKRIIREPTVNRPGLVLTGFTRYFANKRMQVIGNAEAYYLKSISQEERKQRYETLFSYKIPCLVFSRGMNPDRQLLKAAEEADVPVFQTPLITMRFINLATMALEMMFAPHGTEMGSMVDILGVGVIIRGESGIGIINVAAMFGVKSIRTEKQVDLVVSLKSWNDVPDVDRVGMEEEYVSILGVDIPHITIPVRPGRDLARLIEVAAFQTKLKASGYNPAKELNDRLISRMAGTRTM